MPSNVASGQVREARETLQTLMELSQLLGTGLDPETLTICVRLCEAGVNPESLATVIRELTKEVESNNENTDLNGCATTTTTTTNNA